MWMMPLHLHVKQKSDYDMIFYADNFCLSKPVLSEYAQVTKMLGNGRLEAMCFDGVRRLCHIRGKLRKKVGRIQFE